MKNKRKKFLNQLYALRYFFLIAFFFLGANVYAWFVYMSQVNVGLSAKIRSWNVMFEFHDEQIMEDVIFDVAELYPGMSEYSNLASVHNTGESAGAFVYEVKSFKLFGVTYDTSTYTPAQLEQMIENNYPFVIQMGKTDDIVSPGETESFTLTINWDFESGNDELDTQYGESAYTFKQTYPDQPCLQLNVVLSVDQVNS